MTVVAGGTGTVPGSNVSPADGALDNHCPHQGGPLGDGQIETAI